MRIASTIIMVAGLAACATSEPDLPDVSAGQVSTPAASAALLNTSGAEIGTMELTASPHGVLVRLLVTPGGLSAGWHGAHFCRERLATTAAILPHLVSAASFRCPRRARISHLAIAHEPAIATAASIRSRVSAPLRH